MGIDVLAGQNFLPIQGKRIGLITNHTGSDSQGRRTIDILAQAPGVRLAVIFSTEHGLKGTIEHGQSVSDEEDPGTRIPVISLYGKNKRIDPKILQNLDALVFDMQDIGARFYTYATTMAYALEDCAKSGKAFFVLDRPNPITGSVVEGEILGHDVSHFTAYFHIPVRYGLTIGELAQWHNARAKLNATLTVIPLNGWKRSYWWEDTGLVFHAPSPNIQTPGQALLYCGIGAFEATNVAVGRGTPHPFEQFGAPWMNGKKLAEALRRLRLPGVRFKAVTFTPTKDLYSGERCTGVRISVTDRNVIRPVDIFVSAFVLLWQAYPAEFLPRWEEVVRVTGTLFLKETLDDWKKEGKEKPEDVIKTILEKYRKDSRDFLKEREPFLLY